VTVMSALSNTPQRSVYNYARRPILRTGLRPVQLFLVTIAIRLRYDYDTTTIRLRRIARLLPFDAIQREQKNEHVSFSS